MHGCMLLRQECVAEFGTLGEAVGVFQNAAIHVETAGEHQRPRIAECFHFREQRSDIRVEGDDALVVGLVGQASRGATQHAAGLPGEAHREDFRRRPWVVHTLRIPCRFVGGRWIGIASMERNVARTGQTLEADGIKNRNRLLVLSDHAELFEIHDHRRQLSRLDAKYARKRAGAHCELRLPEPIVRRQ